MLQDSSSDLRGVFQVNRTCSITRHFCVGCDAPHVKLEDAEQHETACPRVKHRCPVCNLAFQTKAKLLEHK